MLVICNGRRCVSEPVDESKAEPRPEVNITVIGDVHIDIGMSDNFRAAN